MLVDHHCHIDRHEFAKDLDGVVARARAAGVGIMTNISTRIRRFDDVKAVVERFDCVYGSVGTHPHQAHEELDIPVSEIVRLSKHDKIIAIGEAGLARPDPASAQPPLEAVHAFLARTPCALRLLQADDLAGERVALNLPGTDRERDNWRRRIRVKSADLLPPEPGSP